MYRLTDKRSHLILADELLLDTGLGIEHRHQRRQLIVDEVWLVLSRSVGRRHRKTSNNLPRSMNCISSEIGQPQWKLAHVIGILHQSQKVEDCRCQNFIASRAGVG